MNFNYWTGGTTKNLPSQWSWCGTDPIMGLSDDMKWETGQPDNKGGNEECLHLRFVINETGAIITDRNCSLKYIYACEVSIQYFSTRLLITFTIKGEPGKPTQPPCVPKCPKPLERNVNSLKIFLAY
jgi:hypothetical protein